MPQRHLVPAGAQHPPPPLGGDDRGVGGRELVECARGGHLRRAEEACRLGDAGAVEVAVERHEREALRLGRERANVCLPPVARVAPSAAQRDSQERQVHLLVQGDEGQARLEHPPDPVARGALEGEGHGGPQGRLQGVAVLRHGLHRRAFDGGGHGERHAEGGPPLQGVQPPQVEGEPRDVDGLAIDFCVQRLLDVLPHALPPHVTKQLSMYHCEWYIANQLVTFNDALRALVVFRNRDASSRAYRSFFPAFSS